MLKCSYSMARQDCSCSIRTPDSRTFEEKLSQMIYSTDTGSLYGKRTCTGMVALLNYQVPSCRRMTANFEHVHSGEGHLYRATTMGISALPLVEFHSAKLTLSPCTVVPCLNENVQSSLSFCGRRELNFKLPP